MTTTAAPARTIAATDRGEALHFSQVKVGDYVWHSGCYRLVTATTFNTLRMGRHVSHSGPWTYEVATWLR